MDIYHDAYKPQESGEGQIEHDEETEVSSHV